MSVAATYRGSKTLKLSRCFSDLFGGIAVDIQLVDQLYYELIVDLQYEASK